MMFQHAQFDDGSVSLEAGIMELVDRARGGRLKIFVGQNDGLLEEYRLYHRDEDGRVVSQNDDALSALRYGVMMLRHARTSGWKANFHRQIDYPNLGIV